MAEEPTTEDRLGRLESAVERIEQAVTGLGTNGQDPAPAAPPADVSEQVRAELARARKEQADKDAADADAASAAAEKESTAARLAKLEETPPAPPVKRSTKLLGWGS